ncbi:hypothetical protein CH373_10820 [Leptospira perolatii]|uniref:Uncharacterized protein n=1 Tax=Leptospira perolatii TaxID=2023191 RepID=A0A2M9ZM59_9LEPT|nr:hypothetical protein [Leptospira perolatii]PJZ69856.1 hypothetical protein CH360_09415 [Leptospira perolatii]PJZ73162.1 hypothetical protein CH373_10820 [Leptospira perolatii]
MWKSRRSFRLTHSALFVLLCFLAVLGTPTNVLNADLDSNRATALLRVERGLKENEFHLKAINSNMSNFGTEEQRALYKRCIQHHVETFTLYLQFDLPHSYDEMRQTQRLLVRLYSDTVETYKTQILRELDYLSKFGLRGKDAEAIHHLEMGYRELGAAQIKKTLADNSRPYLPGIKTQYLYEALKLLKQSRKYVVLLSLKYLSDFQPALESNEFEEVFSEINRAMFSNADKYSRIHFDNNFKIYNADNLYEATWETPKLEELERAFGEIDPASDRARRKAKRSDLGTGTE